MTPDSRSPGRDVAAEVRAAARRQAERWSGAGAMFAGILVVGVLMGAFIVLDYTFDQDPHRILKVAIGLLAIGGIVSRPTFGLLLLPIVSPFLPWVPPTPIPGLNALNVLLFTLFGSFIVSQVLARRPFLRGGWLGPAIGVLLGMSALSVVRGAAWPTGYGFNGLTAALVLFRSTMTFTTYFIVLAMTRDAAQRRRITWAVLIGLLLESVATILLGRTGYGGRAVGSIGQSNELGGFLATFTVLAAAVAIGARAWWARLVALAIVVAGGFGILLSLSRGSMLALLGGLFVVTWRGSRAVFAVLLVILLASPLWLPDWVMDRIKGSTVEGQGDAMQVDSASELRLLTWRSVLQVVSEHPLDGVGFTGLQYVLPDVGAELGLGDVKDSAHNTYLRMLSELGIVGLGVFLWLMWKVWRLADRCARDARERFDRAIGLGLAGAVVTLAISCAFGDRFWSPVVVSSFWVLCALAESALREPAPEARA
jgi:O-antigen ligase